MAKKKKVPKTIGEITQSRGTWGDINPITRIRESKKRKNSRRKTKQEIHKEIMNLD